MILELPWADLGARMMGMAFLAALGLLAGTPTLAAEPARSVRNVGVLSGSCDRLVGFGNDLHAECTGKVANVEWSDGRDSFTFTLRNGGVLTFSGSGKGEIRQGPGTVVQPLDVVFATVQDRSQSIRAVGSCRFSDPYQGVMAIICDAQTAQGGFSATFTTDGRPPDIVTPSSAIGSAR